MSRGFKKHGLAHDQFRESVGLRGFCLGSPVRAPREMSGKSTLNQHSKKWQTSLPKSLLQRWNEPDRNGPSTFAHSALLLGTSSVALTCISNAMGVNTSWPN